MDTDNVIVKILSSLKHNGTVYQAGEFLEGTLATFEQLAEAKIVKIIEGAESIEQAKGMDAETIAAAAAEAAAEAAKPKPKDTFGPFEPDAENPAKPEDATAPTVAAGDAGTEKVGDVAPGLVKYTVTGENGIKIADGSVKAKGEVVELNPADAATQYFLGENQIEEVDPAAGL